MGNRARKDRKRAGVKFEHKVRQGTPPLERAVNMRKVDKYVLKTFAEMRASRMQGLADKDKGPR